MKDKTQQIIKASTKVFVEKGYTLATTKEIAEKAEVAEITLFRKFNSKQNLFVYTVKSAIDNKFTYFSDNNKSSSKKDFFKKLLDDRLTVISKNIDVVKMLLKETLANNLPKELEFTKVIFTSIKSTIEEHFKNATKEECEAYSKLVGGILLSSVILPNKKLYYKLSDNEKEEYLNCFLNIKLN